MDKRIELEALITEREGMLAENKYSLNNGQNISYGDEAFNELAERIRAVASQSNSAGDALCSCKKFDCVIFSEKYCPVCGKPVRR